MDDRDKLQLNDGKTEAMLITLRCASTADSVPTSLHVGLSDTKYASQVKTLGVTIDWCLTLHQHVTNVCTSAYIELHSLASICQYLSCDVTKTLISAFVFSKLDYCNSSLTGAPKNFIAKLKRVQNAAARLVQCHRQHNITPVLCSLH